jgi:hypothetical protein
MEINPSRNNVWINTPRGVVSNIVDGPYPDIRVQQTIFDQYGRPLTPDKLLVYRQDKQTRIQVMNAIANDQVPASVALSDPYSYLHIGGAHLFVEGYEHVLLLNDYAVSGSLIYDQFIGLNASRFNVDYYEKNDYSMRPTLGGYYLIGNEFKRNMEGQTTDMSLYYDAFRLPEKSPVAKYSRGLVGYSGRMNFLDMINVNSKSQFIFYRGMIQQKGSVNSVNAYINSRRFLDAQVDEFWAWKVAEFGDSRPKQYPQLKLYATDGQKPNIRFQFTVGSEIVSDSTFNEVSLVKSDRLVNFPQQRDTLENSVLFLDSTVYDLISLKASYVKSHDDVSYRYYKIPFTFDDIKVYKRIADVITTVSAVMVNSYVIRVPLADAMSATALSDDIYFYSLVPAYNKLNPVKLVDVKSHTVDDTIQMWDPARGQHYYRAIHNVDLQTSHDPAVFNNTLTTTADPLTAWKDRQVGSVWLDMSTMAYLPYYDTAVFDTEHQIQKWGQMADWGAVNVFKWIKTLIAPSSYDAVAAQQSTNNLIAQNDKVVGTPRKTLFRRDRLSYQVSVGLPDTLTFSAPHGLTVNDYVLFQDTNLPTTSTGALSADVYYVVHTVVSPTQIKITDVIGNLTAIVMTSAPGLMVATVPFTDDSWIRQPIASEDFSRAVDITTSSIATTAFNDGDVVDVYVNGTLVTTRLSVTSATVAFDATLLNPQDTVTLVRPLHSITVEEAAFNPGPDTDDATVLTQWNSTYEYTLDVIVNDDGTTSTYYYYWVQDDTTYDPSVINDMSPAQVSLQLAFPPSPYIIVRDLLDDPSATGTAETTSPMLYSYGTYQTVPSFYRQAIICNVGDVLNDDDRYVLTFTRDLTLRDDVSSNMKQKHEQWKLIRRSQPDNIDRTLWDKLTESIVGFKLTDPTTRVPSLDRQLYDAANDTETQYGLADGQTFVNGQLALATVLAYLQNSSINFYPIDINTFFALYSFDTPANVILAMDAIYSSFGSTHVNAIWFETLHDALSTKAKYEEFYKTSWIALHGVRLLGVAGLFDD